LTKKLEENLKYEIIKNKEVNMIYIHENNLLNKIRKNYNGKREEIEKFYNDVYLEYRHQLENLDYTSKDINVFKKAAKLIDKYLIEVEKLSDAVRITSQSKCRPTVIEEISSYLFNSLPLIKDGTFGIFNKNIFAGMKINNQMHIDIISKDVDFCIGKKVSLVLDSRQSLQTIIPVVCIEAKTYLDATMFGEAQFSSKQIKNASPNAKTYVLMEYNDVAKEKIISARYDNNINEMFVLRGGSRKDDIAEPLDAQTLLDYYCEISKAVEDTIIEDELITPGRILKL